ncbi:hypothetical protein GCM10023093_29690 [Nemorincola caseinilytica]|uniref:TPM domain-containing protein n=1 Tax=Nemorincola caseinilytica TaxID=2054315 RepID=A0ABP8NQN0_9BACT
MMHRTTYGRLLRTWALALLVMLAGTGAWAKESLFPPRPTPPRLVNDLAGILDPAQEERLEHKLEGFDRTTSTQITVLTVPTLNDYDVSDYAVKVFNAWGIGQKGKNNGVLLLVAPNDRKAWITTGKGLEGVLTDAKTSRIFRNELRPAFKEKDYYTGLDNATDAIIAVTRDEYKSDGIRGEGKRFPTGAIIVIIVVVIASIIKKGGGGGGRRQYRRTGIDDLATGWILGNMLGGGGRSSGWGGGGFGGGGGGFGGFGGGSSGGGGAGGSW